MLAKTLYPINSNLKRIENTSGRITVLKSGKVAFYIRTDSYERKLHSRLQTLHSELQELHFALLGTMVAIQSLSMSSEVEFKELLKDFRSQMATYRQILEEWEAHGYLTTAELQNLANAVLVAFYDLEATLRKLAHRKDRDKPKQVELIEAVAEMSKSAVLSVLAKN
jgi:hypothetical protein